MTTRDQRRAEDHQPDQERGRAEVYASLVVRGGAVHRMPGSKKGVDAGSTTRLRSDDLEPSPTPDLLVGRSLG